MQKIRLAAINYLNTKPFLYGMLRSKALKEQMDIQLQVPSQCGDLLKSGAVDIALIPTAQIGQLGNNYEIVSDFCIGAYQEVKTVGIYSELPLQKVKKIYMDGHSRTSVAITKILLRKLWSIKPELEFVFVGDVKSKIDGENAALVIGDKTIGLEDSVPYFYDLAEEWFRLTNLPVVFACWVAKKGLPTEFLKLFNKSLAFGIRAIPDLLLLLTAPPFQFSLDEYYNRYISYKLDIDKRKSLNLFFKYQQEMQNDDLILLRK